MPLISIVSIAPRRPLTLAVCLLPPGLQQTQSLHCRPGAPEVHLRGLLAHGVGAEQWRDHHDHQPGGERQGKVEARGGQCVGWCRVVSGWCRVVSGGIRVVSGGVSGRGDPPQLRCWGLESAGVQASVREKPP